MQRNILYFSGLLALLTALAIGFNFLLPDLGQASDLARIIQASVTSVAIVAGGIFAAIKLQVFREFAPHVSMTQTITHRAIGDSYVHIFVTATIQNGSKVRVDFRRGYFRLQQVSPISDLDVESLYAGVFVNEKHEHFQWETKDTVERTWEKNGFIVEPGESHQESCEFIVSRGMTSILVDTFLYNERKPAVPVGWGTTSAHDIIHIES